VGTRQLISHLIYDISEDAVGKRGADNYQSSSNFSTTLNIVPDDDYHRRTAITRLAVSPTDEPLLRDTIGEWNRDAKLP